MTRCGWVVNATPQLFYSGELPGTRRRGDWWEGELPGTVVVEVGGRGAQGWSGGCVKISPTTGIRSPDGPSRIESIYRLSYPVPHNVKGNAVPLQAWTGPEGSRKLRFPDFITTAQGWW